MDQELEARLKAQDEKLDAIYVSVERTRKYFLFTMVSTLVFFLVPIPYRVEITGAMCIQQL